MSLNRLILALALSATLVPFAEAGASTAKALKACKTEAQTRYARDGQQARVKLKGVLGAGASQRLRIEVSPPAGDRFLALCEVDRAGKVLSIAPPDKTIAAASAEQR